MGDLRVNALERDFESLIKLLGGTPDERLRFWEILKGITTPAVFRVVEAELGAIEAQVKATHAVLGALKANAKELGAQTVGA
ncbi:MAG: hypothetical protein JF588_13435 [Caulobacterales bacterium]|nr:hypothetical protein [Caulobacterales bacterium]